MQAEWTDKGKKEAVVGGSVQEPQTRCCLVGESVRSRASEDSSLSCWGGNGGGWNPQGKWFDFYRRGPDQMFLKVSFCRMIINILRVVS